jgi:hypothetical protein
MKDAATAVLIARTAAEGGGTRATLAACAAHAATARALVDRAAQKAVLNAGPFAALPPHHRPGPLVIRARFVP